MNPSQMTMNQSEEITTIFVIGFPEDMQDREFQNMFIFSPGFEGATLKFPQGNELESGARKQIIGFAKFRSRLEALQARDIISGKRIDHDRGCVLKAEMAKKNLLIKKFSTSEGAFLTSTMNLTQALTPNGNHGLIKKKFGNSVFDSLFPGGPILPTGLLSPQPQVHEFMDLETSSLLSSSPPYDEDIFDEVNGYLTSATSKVVGYDPKRSLTAPVSFDGVGTSFSFPKFSISTTYNQHNMLFGSADGSPISEHNSFSTSSGGETGLSTSLPAFNSNSPFAAPPGRINSGDQNPPCNTLYVGNLPMNTMEEELRQLFTHQPGYKRLCFRMKPHTGPMCFVEFDNIQYATYSLQELQGHQLSNSIKGGIRLSYSKNPLGVRS